MAYELEQRWILKIQRLKGTTLTKKILECLEHLQECFLNSLSKSLFGESLEQKSLISCHSPTLLLFIFGLEKPKIEDDNICRSN